MDRWLHFIQDFWDSMARKFESEAPPIIWSDCLAFTAGPKKHSQIRWNPKQNAYRIFIIILVQFIPLAVMEYFVKSFLPDHAAKAFNERDLRICLFAGYTASRNTSEEFKLPSELPCTLLLGAPLVPTHCS
ncbi:hypothetical protein WG66_002717 [Moniliophthora roreri]|nr:hypothetical protein WG66_002717 [Moniliophthora roreri]